MACDPVGIRRYRRGLTPVPLDCLDYVILLLASHVEDADATIRILRRRIQNLPFFELGRVCDRFFGEPRQSRGSHRVYRTPWPGDPRVNIQDANGMAKPYQIRQVIKAIEKLGSENQEEGP